MTRGQYLMMCLTAGVALVAYWETQRIGAVLSRISAPDRQRTATGII